MPPVAETQLVPVPLEALQVPPNLDGRAGHNRAPRSACLLDADDDRAAVEQFLREYQGSPATQRAYRKEVERLLLWAVIERGKALSSLGREDFGAYSEFLGDPQPRERWCGPRRGRRGARFTAGWRPFVGPLGAAGRRAALVIINSLLSYLVDARYLAANPLSLLRRRHQQGWTADAGTPALTRCFDAVQWQALLDALEALPQGTAAERAAAERARFLLALLHFLALRVGEAVSHRMGAFVNRRGRWHFAVEGKGQKRALLPVNDELLAALTRYRRSLGLGDLPEPGEETPLLGELERGGAIGARRVHQILKALLACAAAALEAEPQHAARAQHLRRGSAHWFRHTALTRQWESGIPLPQIKENARHSRLDTTLIYVHSEEDARHEEMQRLTWRGPQV